MSRGGGISWPEDTSEQPPVPQTWGASVRGAFPFVLAALAAAGQLVLAVLTEQDLGDRLCSSGAVGVGALMVLAPGALIGADARRRCSASPPSARYLRNRRISDVLVLLAVVGVTVLA